MSELACGAKVLDHFIHHVLSRDLDAYRQARNTVCIDVHVSLGAKTDDCCKNSVWETFGALTL